MISARKAIDDGRRVKKGARVAIVLTEKVEGEVYEHRVLLNKHYIANTIAILGPATVAGQLIPHAVLAEVSLSRGEPYGETSRTNGHGLVRLTDRTPVRTLTRSEAVHLWPIVEDILCWIAEDARSRWKSQEEWWLNRDTRVPRGVSAVISSRDTVFYEKVLLEDFAYRKRKFLRRYAGFLRHWLAGYHRFGYTDAQVKRFPSVQKAVDFWGNTQINAQCRRYLFESLAPHGKAIFRKAVTLAGHPDPATLAAPLFTEASVSLPSLECIALYIRPKERVRQSKKCVVFQILPKNSCL